MPDLRTDGGHLALDSRRVKHWVQPSQDRAAIVAYQTDLDTRRTGSKLCDICFSSVRRKIFAQRGAVKSIANAGTEKGTLLNKQGCQRTVCLMVPLTWTPALGTAKPDLRAELVLNRSV